MPLLSDTHPKPATIFCATGLDFADALAGSTLASRAGDPILLIDPNSLSVPTSSGAYLAQLHELHNAPALVCLGGNVVVPATVLNKVADLLQGNQNQDNPAGAYVYNLDLTTGFTLKGKVSHPGSGAFPQPVKPNDNSAYAFTPIQRTLYIGSNLYTVSESMIKVNELASMQEKGAIYVAK